MISCKLLPLRAVLQGPWGASRTRRAGSCGATLVRIQTRTQARAQCTGERADLRREVDLEATTPSGKAHLVPLAGGHRRRLGLHALGHESHHGLADVGSVREQQGSKKNVGIKVEAVGDDLAGEREADLKAARKGGRRPSSG